MYQMHRANTGAFGDIVIRDGIGIGILVHYGAELSSMIVRRTPMDAANASIFSIT
ncbi:hypothetical protein [Methylomonas fluvii]|nr:hypothetical protein [Methylomonas fluvii]